VVYWREYHSKRCLVRRLFHLESPKVHTTSCLVYCWAWCLLAWYATGISASWSLFADAGAARATAASAGMSS
jgi:hypothetical protein